MAAGIESNIAAFCAAISNSARLFVLAMFRHWTGMVGPPKTLHDLRRIDATVRVTCSGCGAMKLRDLEELIAERVAYRKSLEWQMVCAELRCGEVACLDHRCRVEVVPFGENTPELRQRRWNIFVINLALTVLREAVSHQHRGDGGTSAVRLALRVLHPHLREPEMLATFWTQVTTPRDSPWSGADQSFRWITTTLEKKGWPLWAEFR